MTDAIKKCSATETAACCCVDVGTVMDNTDCTASWSEWFAQRADAEAKLAQLTERAREVESEPCLIESRFSEVDQGVQLDIDFTFSCQAETMIFQLVCVKSHYAASLRRFSFSCFPSHFFPSDIGGSPACG